MRRLSLDHITVVDATPADLARLAAATGCAGICPFLHFMPVLPAMPPYDLVRDAAARRETRRVLAGEGVAVDLAYPFTVAGRTLVADLEPALAAASELGAPLVNVLSYDREPQRRVERLAELAACAAGYGIALAIEFYGPSQVRSLGEARALVSAIGRADVGITLDMLHLVRADEWPGADLAEPAIRIVQLCDGPAVPPEAGVEWEAGIERLLPSDGAFALPAMLSAIAADVPLSVEVPRQSAIDAGVPRIDRARAAVEATRRAVAGGTV